MRLTKRKFTSMKKRARKVGACTIDIDIIDGLSLEQFIDHPYYNFWMRWYWRFVLKRARWPDGEESILLSEYWGYIYARRVLKRRWLKYENYCLKIINRALVDMDWGPVWECGYLQHFELELVDV